METQRSSKSQSIITNSSTDRTVINKHDMHIDRLVCDDVIHSGAVPSTPTVSNNTQEHDMNNIISTFIIKNKTLLSFQRIKSGVKKHRFVYFYFVFGWY